VPALRIDAAAAFNGVLLPRIVVIVLRSSALFREKALAFFFSFSPFPPFFYRKV